MVAALFCFRLRTFRLAHRTGCGLTCDGCCLNSADLVRFGPQPKRLSAALSSWFFSGDTGEAGTETVYLLSKRRQACRACLAIDFLPPPHRLVAPDVCGLESLFYFGDFFWPAPKAGPRGM